MGTVTIGPSIVSALLTGLNLSTAAAWPVGATTVEVDLTDSLFTDVTTAVEWTGQVSRDNGVTWEDTAKATSQGGVVDTPRAVASGVNNPGTVTHMRVWMQITGSGTIGATSKMS